MSKCINCKKEYKTTFSENYNLNLCDECYKKLEKKISHNESIDNVTHKVICPKCKKVYDERILHSKCKTKDCNVYFFWDDLDCRVIARWVDL